MLSEVRTITKWKLSVEDQKIVFLIKTMHKRYLEDTLKKGSFCFNYPSVFNAVPDLAPAQKDEWDSHLSYHAIRILFAPISLEDENGGIYYERPTKIEDRALVHQISARSEFTPLCSFRKVDKGEILEKYGVGFFRLGDTVDRIRRGFGHDAFILVYQPQIFLSRISLISSYFARSVHYGEIDSSFQEFLDLYSFKQKEMFQKGEEYAWQKEFRVIIEPRRSQGPQIIQIGSIEDIAFGGDIEMLRQGFIFGENEKAIKEAFFQVGEKGDPYI